MAAERGATEQQSGVNARSPRHHAGEQIIDARGVESLLDQLADTIRGEFSNAPNLSLIGIRRRGDVLAQRLRARLTHRLGFEPPCGTLDITLYRDDFDSLTEQPVVGKTDIPFPLEGSAVILVDDVLFTGRTVRAALDEILDLGRPARIALVVLVDRGWRELPIAADFVGQQLTTGRDDDVQVLLKETDGRDEVRITRSESVSRDV